MAQETFGMYIARLRACGKLSEIDRNAAADQLEKWESGDVGDVNYGKYATWSDRGIISAFYWDKTLQGVYFWKRIFEAGF